MHTETSYFSSQPGNLSREQINAKIWRTLLNVQSPRVPSYGGLHAPKTRVHLVKVMVFPVVMYGCESCTVRKAERRRIDALELWC